MRPITLEAQKFDAHCNTGSSLHSRLHGPSVGTVSTPQTGSDSYETTTKASAGAVGLMGLFISMTKLGEGLGLQRMFVCPPLSPCLVCLWWWWWWGVGFLCPSLTLSQCRCQPFSVCASMAICASWRWQFVPVGEIQASGCRSRAWSVGAWNHF